MTLAQLMDRVRAATSSVPCIAEAKDALGRDVGDAVIVGVVVRVVVMFGGGHGALLSG